ncbi:NAD(P)-binding domain-containing protein, partial [Rhodoplanes serenus]
FDLSDEALAEAEAAGAVRCTSVADLAAEADVIFLSLPGGPQVEAVTDEILAQATSCTAVVDLSTTPVELARKVAAKLAERGIAFADA